jgi:acetyl esterase/lipase
MVAAGRPVIARNCDVRRRTWRILGVVGLAIEYRLAPANRFPAAVYDAKAAVRFLRANATKYNIDPKRIFAIGSSAGGHLAALLGVTNGDPKLEGDVCCRAFPPT